MQLKGKTAVVTGAASGMGEATARILVDLGADVTALDIKDTAIPVARALKIDLRDRANIEEVAESIDGPVDGLFSCAGLPGPPFSEWDTILVNFVGARHLAEQLVPKMSEGSAISVISPVSARKAVANSGKAWWANWATSGFMVRLLRIRRHGTENRNEPSRCEPRQQASGSRPTASGISTAIIVSLRTNGQQRLCFASSGDSGSYAAPFGLERAIVRSPMGRWDETGWPALTSSGNGDLGHHQDGAVGLDQVDAAVALVHAWLSSSFENISVPRLHGDE